MLYKNIKALTCFNWLSLKKNDKDQESVCVHIRFGKGAWLVKYYTDVWSGFEYKSKDGQWGKLEWISEKKGKDWSGTQL